MTLEILVLCIFPYPKVNAEVSLPMRYNMEDMNICYNLSEILYAFMFFRFFWILRALIFYSRYQNLVSTSYDYDFRYKPNVRFLVKCLLYDHPITFLSAISTFTLIIYSFTFRIFDFPTTGSNTEGVKKNDDGSFTVYFGPEAPKGFEKNWVQTVPDKSWFVILRMYSPLKPWIDQSWRPGEAELVK